MSSKAAVFASVAVMTAHHSPIGEPGVGEDQDVDRPRHGGIPGDAFPKAESDSMYSPSSTPVLMALSLGACGNQGGDDKRREGFGRHREVVHVGGGAHHGNLFGLDAKPLGDLLVNLLGVDLRPRSVVVRHGPAGSAAKTLGAAWLAAARTSTMPSLVESNAVSAGSERQVSFPTDSSLSDFTMNACALKSGDRAMSSAATKAGMGRVRTGIILGCVFMCFRVVHSVAVLAYQIIEFFDVG